MVNSTYKLSWIPIQSNDVLKIDRSALECIDVYNGCDFGLFDLEEQYHLLNYNKIYSSFLLSEFETPTHEPMHQIASIIDPKSKRI